MEDCFYMEQNHLLYRVMRLHGSVTDKNIMSLRQKPVLNLEIYLTEVRRVFLFI